jgi:hypothetical protein
LCFVQSGTGVMHALTKVVGVFIACHTVGGTIRDCRIEETFQQATAP